MPRTFSHSGDIGDVIYAMPTVKAFGGGKLYLYPHRQTRLNRVSAESLATLLVEQSYIDAVEFNPTQGEINLDRWAAHYHQRLSLATMTLRAFQKPFHFAEQPWLTVPYRNEVARVVIHRSPRYHAPSFPWKRVVEKYRGEIAMVGMTYEHREFCARYGPVPYFQTNTYLELAAVIAGSFLFIGNQSSPYAVAEGMKHNTIQEVDASIPNCLFDRANAGYGIDDSLYLPELL